MKKLCSLSIFAFVLLLTPSCTSDEECTVVRMVEDQLQWTPFKKGTYWIYRETSLGILDSVWVYKDTTYDIISDGRVTPACFERREIFLTNSNTQDTLYIGTAAIMQFVRLHRLSGKHNPEVASDCPLTPNLPINFSEQTPITFPAYKTTFDSSFTSYVVQMDTFKNVVRGKSTVNPVFYGNTSTIYFAEGVGIIKKSFPESGYEWELIRHHIIK